MKEKNKEYLKLYLQGIFKCETRIEEIFTTCNQFECTSIYCKFADDLHVRVDLPVEVINERFSTFEDVDRNKFNIALRVYQEIVLMRVRSLCNVELGYFSN